LFLLQFIAKMKIAFTLIIDLTFGGINMVKKSKRAKGPNPEN